MSDLGIAVIGAGRIAQAAHLPALARAEGAQLVGLCDPSAVLSSQVAARYGVPGYAHVDDLLAAPGVEAVIVAVPDRLHLPLASAALEAGKHVLVEKPLAASVGEAEQLAAAAARTGLKLQVGAMKRYDPGVQYAADAVRNTIGQVLSASVWYRVMSALRPPTEATHFPALVVDDDVRAHEATYKADRASYLLTTHGAHVLDGLHFLLGGLADISARSTRSGKDFAWHGIAGLSEGGLAHFDIAANVHAEWSEGADIYGEHGYVKLRSHFPFELRASDVEVFTEATGTATRPVFGDSSAYERQIEAFAAAVTGNQQTFPDAEDGVAAVKLIDAVAESVANEGRTVKL